MTTEEVRPDYLLPGTRIGSYVVRTLLGQGGSGSVYEVQSSEGNLFALKICRHKPGPHGTVDWRMDRRCTRSIVCLEQLKGVRNVAEIFGHDRHPDPHTGYQYLVQELVPGSLTITDWVKRQRPPLVKIVTAFQELAELCGELAFADIRHRDLKPANVLMAPGDIPKVIDFESAICFRPEPLTRKAASAQPCTRGHYSPELCKAILEEKRTGKAEVFDYFPWSDLHALGVVFYECLTGEHPFDTSLPDDELLLEVAFEDPIHPMLLNASVPFGLNKVVMRLLEKDPLDRYQHGDRVAEDLRTLLEKVADDSWTMPFEQPDLDDVTPIRRSRVTVLAARALEDSTSRGMPEPTPMPVPVALERVVPATLLLPGAKTSRARRRRTGLAAALLLLLGAAAALGLRGTTPARPPPVAVAAPDHRSALPAPVAEPPSSPVAAAVNKGPPRARRAAILDLGAPAAKARPEDDVAWLARCARKAKTATAPGLAPAPADDQAPVFATLEAGLNVAQRKMGYEVRDGEISAVVAATPFTAAARLTGTMSERVDGVSFRFTKLKTADGRARPICAIGSSSPLVADSLHPGYSHVTTGQIRIQAAPGTPGLSGAFPADG